MKKKLIAKIMLVFFLLVTLVEVYSVYFHKVGLESVVKPFIIIFLSAFYILSAKKINIWYLLALFFSFLGDFFLLDLQYFLIGTSCFLIVHLIYVKITIDYIGKFSTGKVMLPLFFFLAFSIVVISLIKDRIDSFIVLVLCYGTVLCSFAALSFFNNVERPNKANKILFFGAFTFIVTNALIGLNRFYGVGDFSRSITMVGYSLAQYLVCIAVIKKNNFRNDFRKETILLSICFFTAIVGLLVITTGSYESAFIVIPLVFLSLIMLYVGSVKRTQLYVLIYLFLVVLAETLLLFKKEYLHLAMISSILSQLILVYYIITYRNIKIKSALLYFMAIIISYTVLYYYVINIEKHFLYVIFGYTNAILTSLALDNYINKMRMPNYLLWLGISFGVLDNIIMSLDIYNSHLNVYSFVVNVISHYLICRSFILREKRMSRLRI